MSDIELALRETALEPYRTEAEDAVGGVARLAAGDGILDVAYEVVDTPVGHLVAAATDEGLLTLSYAETEAVLDDLAQRVSPRILRARGRLDDVRRELDEYFAGRRRHFDLRLDWRLAHGFRRRALDALVAVPYGSVVTYRQLAARAGNELAVRAAGSACATNPLPIVIPCHRVLRTDGGLGGYGGGIDRKRQLLHLEGAAGW